MSEMIASLASGGPSAAPSPAAPGAPTQDAGAEPQKGGNQEFAFKRLQQKLYTGQRELQSLREEVAELRGRSIASPNLVAPSSAPKSWEAMTDEQLDQAIDIGLNPESLNRAAVIAANNEKLRRVEERAKEGARGVGAKEYERARLMDTIRSKIANDFGAAALNDQSEVFALADRYYGQFIQRYGKDIVAQSPDFLYDAFSRADRDLHTGEREKLRTTEAELDRMKREQALARGGMVPGVSRPPESVAALQRGDLKGAIRGTGLFKSVVSDARAKYGR